MSIISQQTWNKFTQEEKEVIRDGYLSLAKINADTTCRHYEMLFGKENLQPQPLTYEDVAIELFNNGAWQPHDSASKYCFDRNAGPTYFLNCTSEKQAEKLLAINKLLNVAKFLNKDWKPDWKDPEEEKWTLQIYRNEIDYTTEYSGNGSLVYFESKNLAQQTVKILGEDTVRLALSSDW